jgi:hypothetical protein
MSIARINESFNSKGDSVTESVSMVYHDTHKRINDAISTIPMVRDVVKPVSHQTIKLEYTSNDYLLAKMIRQRYNDVSYQYSLHIAHYINQYTKGHVWPTPLTVASIIEIESQYNRNAVSDCGARGLMQISPMWSNVIPKYAYTSDRYNIKYGIKILRHYYKLYDGNKSAAILSYNSGNLAYNAGHAWPGYWYRYTSAKKAFDRLYQDDL